jgi:hypothetical protein
MAQDIAKLQAVGQNIRQKLSPRPLSRTVPVSPSRNAPAKRYAPGNRSAVIVRASPGARTQTAIARASGSIIKRLIYPSTIRVAHNSL